MVRPWNWEKRKRLGYAEFAKSRGRARTIPLTPAAKFVALLSMDRRLVVKCSVLCEP